MIRGKYLTSKDDIAPVLAVRNAVFVEEQGFSAEGGRDAYDDMAIYALAFNEEGAPVSTGRLFVDRDGQFTIGRVCTLRAYRGQGYGDLIMRMLLYRAQELHAPGIYIHSQAPVAHFYEHYGFQPTGKIEYDESVEHILLYPKAEHISHEGSRAQCANASPEAK